MVQEKNCRKGKFSPSKLKGKRVIELGAGCGVAGFGKSLLFLHDLFYKCYLEMALFYSDLLPRHLLSVGGVFYRHGIVGMRCSFN